MESESCCFGQFPGEGEIKFYNLHSGVLELESAFEVYAVDVGGFHNLIAYRKVHGVDALGSRGESH